jgi:actin-related protein
MSSGINVDAYSAICAWAYTKLGTEPGARPLILTEPQSMTDRDRQRLCEILLETHGVPACLFRPQPLLAMYSYSASSGIVVDIGDRIDVAAFDQGFSIDRADSHLRWGGQEITDGMARMLGELGHRFFSPVEGYIARLVKERVAFVASSFEEAIIHERELAPSVVDVRRYGIPDGTKTFTVGSAMFRSTEGLFDPAQWGKDSPGLHEIVFKAIQSASIDARRALCRSIYLSGGSSMLPGLDERLRREVQALVPASSLVTVHANKYRNHAAFRGAGMLATLANFQSMCVWQEDWNEVSPRSSFSVCGEMRWMCGCSFWCCIIESLLMILPVLALVLLHVTRQVGPAALNKWKEEIMQAGSYGGNDDDDDDFDVPIRGGGGATPARAGGDGEDEEEED